MNGWVDDSHAAESTLSLSPHKYKHSWETILGAGITEIAAQHDWTEVRTIFYGVTEIIKYFQGKRLILKPNFEAWNQDFQWVTHISDWTIWGATEPIVLCF